ncbi:MAG: hypothetical protein AAEI92_11685, partial [Arenicellales bacterium]
MTKTSSWRAIITHQATAPTIPPWRKIDDCMWYARRDHEQAVIERPRQLLDNGWVLGLADLHYFITGAGQAIWSHYRSFLCRRSAIDRVLHLSTGAGTACNRRSTSELSAIRAVTVVAELIWCKRDRVSDLTADATTPCPPNNLRFPRAFFGLLLSPPRWTDPATGKPRGVTI